MQEGREYNTVILAALLGKMLKLMPSLKSIVLSKDLLEKLSVIIDKNLFKELVAENTNTNNQFILFIRHLLNCAEEYTSIENKLPFQHISNGHSIPLASTFSYLQLDKPLNKTKFYKFQQLSPDNGFPVNEEEVDYKDRDVLMQKFESDFLDMVEKLKPTSFDIFYTHLTVLLQKYLWCIPLNTDGEGSDIGWFDYLKNTAAIAACLYKYYWDIQDFDVSPINEGSKQQFILLVGDFSGIQRYLFHISSTGAGGIAKRLRARSFYLTVLSEAISHKILHEFDLPLLNIVMASGGNFYILLPNTEQAEHRIKKLQQSFDEWFLDQYGGELSLNLAHTSFSGTDFKQFGNVLNRLSGQLGKKKSRPLFDCLVDASGKWNEEKFIRAFEGKKDLGLCQGCGKNLAEKMTESWALCEHCSKDLHMGRLLPKARYITFSRASASGKGFFPLLDGYSFRLWSEVPTTDETIYLAVKLNDTNCKELFEFPASFRYIANYVPTAKEGDKADYSDHEMPKDIVYDFDHVAARSIGRELLGYLKADVDYLGSLLIFGLMDEKRNLNTISRISTLSRMLDIFFSGWIHQTVQNEFPNCYIVFSGGDDLLIIGPWNETIELSKKINDAFRKFTADNLNITLSAGIAFAKPKIPVSVVVKQAEEKLECSKEEVDCLSEEGSRNQLTAFNETVKWNRVETLLKDAKLLADWLNEDHISSGFVHNLTIYNTIFKRYQKYGESYGLRFLPLLCYDIVRNLPPIDDKDPQKRLVRLWAEELKDIHGQRMNFLGFITGYALNANRR